MVRRDKQRAPKTFDLNKHRRAEHNVGTDEGVVFKTLWRKDRTESESPEGGFQAKTNTKQGFQIVGSVDEATLNFSARKDDGVGSMSGRIGKVKTSPGLIPG